VFLKILFLRYADDTFLISEDPVKLQECLNDFVQYCYIWNLDINVSKTKILVIGSRNDYNFNFKILK
jgi:hypothetical protein